MRSATIPRAIEEINGYLKRAAIKTFQPKIPALPTDFWPWAESSSWACYTPEQKATLIASGYSTNLATAGTPNYTPFTQSTVRVELGAGDRGNRVRCAVQMPANPPGAYHVPLFKTETLKALLSRGPGQYVSTYGLQDFYGDISDQLWAHITDVGSWGGAITQPGADVPPALVAWIEAVKAIQKEAAIYSEASSYIDTMWQELSRQGTELSRRRELPRRLLGGCSLGTYLMAVPEWVPMSLMNKTTGKRRRTRLTDAVRVKAETALEACFPTAPCTPQYFDVTQPMLPQLRNYLLPMLTAYRLSGEDNLDTLRLTRMVRR